MADAYKCDRCGEYKDGKPECLFEFPNPFRQGLTDNDERKMSLCADCQDALTEFMSMSADDDNGLFNVEFEYTGEPIAGTTNHEFPSFSDRVRTLEMDIQQPRRMRRTDLKRQVDMGAKNY
jgi:hypothetical protein